MPARGQFVVLQSRLQLGAVCATFGFAVRVDRLVISFQVWPLTIASILHCLPAVADRQYYSG